MEIDLTAFYGNKSLPQEFRTYIYTPFLLKTRLNIVYTDLINWERSGLLNIDYGVDIDKTQYKSTALCFMEYVWLSIIAELRSFGFSYDQINEFGELLTQPITVSMLKAAYEGNPHFFEATYDSNNAKANLIKLKEFKTSQTSSYITLLEYLVKDTILNKQQLRILFFKNPTAFEIVNKSSLLEMNSNPNPELKAKFNQKIDQSHFSFSLSALTQKYLDTAHTDFLSDHLDILTPVEHKIMTLIRQRYNQLLDVKISYQNKSAIRIELKTLQKSIAEKRIIEYLNKGDYGTLEFKAVDGNIIRFEKTETHKL